MTHRLAKLPLIALFAIGAILPASTYAQYGWIMNPHQAPATPAATPWMKALQSAKNKLVPSPQVPGPQAMMPMQGYPQMHSAQQPMMVPPNAQVVSDVAMTPFAQGMQQPVPGMRPPMQQQPGMPYYGQASQQPHTVGRAYPPAQPNMHPQVGYHPPANPYMPQANPFVAQQAPTPAGMPTPAGIPTPTGTPLATANTQQPLMTLLREATHLEKTGNLDGAEQKYGQALQMAPHSWHVLLSFARLKHRQGDMLSSTAMYQQLLNTFPDDAVALNDLGLLMARQGNIAGATEQLTKAVKLQPQSKRYRNNLATVLIESNKLNEALANLQDVHGEAIGEFNMGCLLAQRGKTQLASEHLRVALQLDPSLNPAREMLARMGGAAATARTATRPTPGPQPIMLQSGEMGPAADSAVAPSVYEASDGSPSNVAPLPAEFEIPGLQK